MQMVGHIRESGVPSFAKAIPPKKADLLQLRVQLTTVPRTCHTLDIFLDW